MEKQGANWYSLEVSQQQMDAGFVISAHSAGGSKFKLLLFESTPEGVNELVAQVCPAPPHAAGQHASRGMRASKQRPA